MEKEHLMDEVIKERKKLPEEVKGFIKSNILFNIIMAIIMLGCTLIINITYSKFSTDMFEKYVHIFQLILAIITIVFFETAYKKDSFLISFYGIEMFVFSLAVMFVPYFYILKGMLNALIFIAGGFTIYYIFKSIFTAMNIRNNYIKNNISDVKEIVQDHKKGYIDEESKKTLRENKKKMQENILKQEAKTQNKKEGKKESKTQNKTESKKESKTSSKPETKKEPQKSSKTEPKKGTKTKKQTNTYSTDKLDENINKLNKLKNNNKLFENNDNKK